MNIIKKLKVLLDLDREIKQKYGDLSADEVGRIDKNYS